MKYKYKVTLYTAPAGCPDVPHHSFYTNDILKIISMKKKLTEQANQHKYTMMEIHLQNKPSTSQHQFQYFHFK